MRKHSILFVCSANICRSPMAEGLLHHLVRNEEDQWEIASAGVWPIPGCPAAEHVIEILHRHGVDLQQHVSKGVTPDMLAEYQLILTMERGQKEALQLAFPEYASKIYLLSEMVSSSFEITDPIGKPIEEFEAVAEEIERILKEGMARIRSLSSSLYAEDRSSYA